MSVDDEGRRRWLTAALCSGALLVVPVVAWLALPAPERPGATTAPPTRGAPAPEATLRPTRAAPVPPSGRRGVAPARADDERGVEGEVQAPDGRPVAGATVTCQAGEHELVAESDEAGKFRLSAEATGCKAKARKKGFASSEEEVIRAGAANRLRLAPPAGIAGSVVDEAGAPVMSFHVAVTSFTPSSGAPDASVALPQRLEVDDPGGAFEWTDMAPGKYVLGIAVGQAVSRSQSIDVAPGQMTRGVRVVLERGGVVEVTLRDAVTHEPVDGVNAMVFLGDLALRSQMSRGGKLTLEGVPAGPFEMKLIHVLYDEKTVRDLTMPRGTAPLHVEAELTRRGQQPPGGR